MKNRKLHYALIICLFPVFCHARIGDTLQSLTNRLGGDGLKMVGPTPDLVPDAFNYAFEKNGIIELVTFWHGRSVAEIYSKAPDSSGSPGTFSSEEVNAITAKNILTVGGNWFFPENPAGSIIWQRKGEYGMPDNPTGIGHYSAYRISLGLVKYDDARQAAQVAKDKKDAKNKLNNF